MERYGAMDRVLGRHWAKAVGVALVGILLAALLSFDLYDPTLTNLRYPMDGIANLAGLPGALLAGTVVEFFGASAFLLPMFLLNWVLVSGAPGARSARVIYAAAALICLTTLHGLVAGEEQLPGFTAPGLAGLAGGRWMLRTVGLVPGLLLLLPTLAYALTRAFHLPWMRVVLADGQLFAVYFARSGRAAAGNLRTAAGKLRESRGQAGLGWAHLPARLAVLWPGKRWPGKGWPGMRRPETGWLGLGRRRDNSAPPAAHQGRIRPQVREGKRKHPLPKSPSRPVAGDGFDSWLSALGDAPAEPERLEKS